MSVDSVRRALVQAKTDGHVSPDEVDRIMLQARDGGGLDAKERTALLSAADGFDDATKQRLLTHLSAMAQKNAWVNVDVAGQVASLTGRQASLNAGVPGLSAKVGLFDNGFSLKGTATAAGKLTLTVEGKAVTVQVARGETAAQVLERVRAGLPSQVTGLVLSGELQPNDPALFSGPAARRDETAAHLMLYKPAALGLRPGEKPLRVVVTGYGAFMGITDNPSAAMAQKLAEAGVPGAIVEYRRLDVTTEAVDAFLADLQKNPPDLVLSMGVGGQAQVEERPENQLDAGTDGAGHQMTARKIRQGGPDELATDLPIDVVEWGLAHSTGPRQVFTSKSDPNYQPDRSAYLCNYLGYSLASAFGSTPATTAGFMHVTNTTPVNQMHAVLEALVAHQLDWKRQPVPTT